MVKGWFFGVLPTGGQVTCRDLGRERERVIRRRRKKGWIMGRKRRSRRWDMKLGNKTNNGVT